MSEMKDKEVRTGLEVAVIGTAGRFPGARDLHEFWNNLKNGVETISFFSTTELEETVNDGELLKNTNYVKARGILPDIEYFDAAFFGYTPKEAQITDPQIRLFYECVWEALEDAGYDPGCSKGRIGLYAGASSSFYWEALIRLAGTNETIDPLTAANLNSKDLMCMQVSYKFNLKGPSFTLHTTCSTSLVAVHLAVQGLLGGECEIALAGGVSLSSPFTRKSGYLYQKEMIMSPDGHCRAFDAAAKGTVGGEGAGVVVLKLLEEAVTAGDHIYAIVKGSAINNDGIRKAGFTAPSVEGQAEVISAAMHMAEVEPESISYIETHGTGTVLGDPIEIEALKLAFETDKQHFCPIGSIKTNIGHLDTAAGIAGFIKTVLVLKHRLIPPSLHFNTSNPKIDFENSSFYVVTQLTRWENDKYPFRAGVSSFGIGGTNAHVILEEAPEGTGGLAPLPGEEVPGQGRGGVSPPSQSREYQLILLSAMTPSALDQMTKNLVNFLKENPVTHGLTLADAAYTLQVGRKQFRNRKMLVCSTAAQLIKELASPTSAKTEFFFSKQDERSVIYLFPGQGSQYVNMGRDLYDAEPLFKEEMDRCFEILNGLLDYDIKEILYPQNRSYRSYTSNKSYKSNQAQINQTEIAQPILFIFENALAKLLMKWGIKPDAMMGHSIGEYVAAHLAGVFSLEDALELVVLRARLMQEMPPGGMLGVQLSQQEITPLLKEELSLAAVNGPSHCVVSGPQEALDNLARDLEEKGSKYRHLHTSHAFHSKMMDPILKEFEKGIGKVTRHSPGIPYISNVTGNWIMVEQAADPGYWAVHLRETVCFEKGIKELLKEDDVIFIEIGPGKTLGTFVRQHTDKKTSHRVINFVKHPREDIPDTYLLLNKIGQLWLYGIKPDWSAFYASQKRYRISLPTYPFEKQKFHIEGNLHKIGPGILTAKPSIIKKPEISYWFYIPSWKRTGFPLYNEARVSRVCANSLIFIDDCGIGLQLLEKLGKKGQGSTIARIGTTFTQETPGIYQLNPKQPKHYELLFQELKNKGVIPVVIIHLWSLSPADCRKPGQGRVRKLQDVGFYSLINIARSIGKLGFTSKIQLVIVTNNLHEATGEEELSPGNATILGPIKVIPQEYPNINCRSIDILLANSTGKKDKKLIQRLLVELCCESQEKVVAHRGNHRWVQTFEPMTLEKSNDKPRILKDRGVYMIVGGLGNIGLVLAEYLAKSVRARLILTGRSSFPAKEDWKKWLDTHDDMNHTSRKILKIRKLEKSGAEILVFRADMTNKKQMQQVIDQVEKQLGKLDGVVHSAVSTKRGLKAIRDLETGICEEEFQAKIYGLLVLEDILKNKDIDFCLLMSSLSSVLGGLGFASYSSANLFMDAFVDWHNRANPAPASSPWTAINWDGWKFSEAQKQGTVGAALEDLAITPEQGLKALQYIFSSNDNPRLIVSTGDLQARYEQWIQLEPSKKAGDSNKEKISVSPSRPNLTKSYAAPGSKLEMRLANLWQEFFGFQQVGIHDDFFELGGDSLKALSMISNIHKALGVEIPLAEFFREPTIHRQAKYITKAEQKEYFSIQPTEKKEYYVLSSAQERLYILHQMELNSTAYNVPTVIPLTGEMDMVKSEETFKKLINRHESLRTSFHMEEDQPVQRVHDEVEFKIEYHSAKRKAQSAERPFDLTQAPLLRVGFIELLHTPIAPRNRTRRGTYTSPKEKEGKYLLIIDMHHIISDGTSHGILQREFNALYTGKNLPPLKLQYKDYSQWQNSDPQQQIMKIQEKYWLKELSGELPVLNIPTDYPRPLVQSFEGRRLYFYINKQITGTLKELCQKTGATLYMILLSVLNILLSKLSNQADIIVGTPIAGRRHAELQDIVGMFVNTLSMRNYPEPDKVFLTFLKEVKERTLQTYENQEYQFEDLVEKVFVNRDISRNPVFDVMFNLLNQAENTGSISQSSPDAIEDGEKCKANFDITFQAVEIGEVIHFTVIYCTKLYKIDTVKRLINYFKKIAAQINENPHKRLSSIVMLSGDERRRILYNFNNTAAPYPEDKTLHQLFVEQEERTPDNIAVIGKMQSAERKAQSIERNKERHAPCAMRCALTYRELKEKSNQLAHLLRERGVQADTIVAILVERCVEMMIGLLGILRAGGAYLPIDPEYPEERIKYMLKDSGAKILLAAPDLTSASKSSLLTLTSPSTCQVSPTNLAYVIYTSGSTGKPKGVMVKNSSAVNILWALHNEYPAGETAVYLLKTSYMFDVSVTELFGWYLVGSRLVVLEKGGEKDPLQIIEVIANQGVTHINFVPSMFSVFQESLHPGNRGQLSSLKYIFLAGEALLPGIVEKFPGHRSHITLENIYGPTEAAVYASKYSLAHWDGAGTIPIGKPLPNIKIYILNQDILLQPIGVPGELCITGAGLARGYINQPELTAEKFDHDLWDYQDYPDKRKKVPGNKILKGTHKDHMQSCNHAVMQPCSHETMQLSPHYPPQYLTPSPHHPIYRTGDLARWQSDGNIEFLGRIDFQVKIRGFRVEMGEIENRLLNHVEISEAVVQARNGALCAYIVSEKEPNVPALKEYLAARLPGYMIPTYFVHLEEIPLTRNNKIDRNALPLPGITPDSEYVVPRDEIEKKLVKIWEEVLDRNTLSASIGINDNFFELGGHSLKAAVLTSRIHKELHIKIPLGELFAAPTIKGLSHYIKENAREDKFTTIEPAEEREYYVLSPAQQRLYILQQMEVENTAYNMPAVMILEGKIGKTRIRETFLKLIKRHESLRTSFHMWENQPVQQVHDEVEFEIEYYQVEVEVTVEEKQSPLLEGTRGVAPLPEEPAAALISAFIRPFNLSRAPLLRVGLIKLPHTPAAHRGHPSQEGKDSRFILMVDMHHIITDGTSLGILRREFMQIYAEEELVPPGIQFKDYAQWQNKEKQRLEIKKQETYWLKEFQEKIPLLHLPIDSARPTVQSFEGNTVPFKLGEKETGLLKTYALHQGATLFMVLLALYKILLSKLSGQEDIVVGTPVRGRRHTDLEGIIGMIVNTLALRNYPSSQKSFKRFLKEIKRKTLNAYENQDYPFEELVEQVVLNRDASRNPLFDVMFILQNVEIPEIKIKGMTLAPYEYETKISKFDLTLSALETGKNLLFAFEYCTKLFNKETVERFIKYYKKIVDSVLNKVEIKIAEIEIIPGEEKKKILVDFNKTEREYPADRTVHELFEEQVERTPDRIAIVGPYVTIGAINESPPPQITYNQLNQKSNQLAILLREKGVKTDTIVGIMVERSIEMTVGILGILKAGGAYLPIDSNHPKGRVNYMLIDSKVSLLVKNSNNFRILNRGKEKKERFKEIEIVNCQWSMVNGQREKTPSFHLHLSPAPATRLVYVIYTSGSTGKPKGVMIQHSSVINVLDTLHKEYPFSEADVYLLKTSYTFDVSVTELFGWFLGGGRLAILENEAEKDLGRIIKVINDQRVSHINFVPSMFNMLVASLDQKNIAHLSGLKYIFLAGETLLALTVKRFRELGSKIKLENIYGPTEGTVYCSKYSLSEWNGIGNIPIGKPLQNMKLYILDKNNHLQPCGVPGELCITGTGTARGYLNNPELTAEKFCPRLPGGRRMAHGAWRFAHSVNRVLTLRPALCALRTPPRKNFSLKGARKNYMQSCNYTTMQLFPNRSLHYPITPLPHYPIYMTGDLGRWQPDGNIEFLGRIDHQAKIRGFRIEPGEIENQLLLHKEIKEVVIVDKVDAAGDKFLCAYIVAERRAQGARPGEIEVDKLREYLSARLPDYMIPSYVVFLEGIPLTPNGKIDRKALPEPKIKGEETVVVPSSEIEKKLANIWSEVLGINKNAIGINDNFFRLGGHSLKAAILTSKIDKQMNINIPLGKIFQSPTIRGLAAYLDKTEEKLMYAPIKPLEEKEYYPVSSAQKRMLILHQYKGDDISDNTSGVLQIEGKPDRERFEETIRSLIMRHEAFRTSFEILDNGPVQRVHRSREIDFHITYLKVKESEIQHIITQFIVPFDLSQPPLLRMGLVKITPEKHILMFDMHHILSDATSMSIIFSEFIALYDGIDLPKSNIRYKDFSVWQNKLLQTEAVRKQEEYWLETFSDAVQIPPLHMPLDFPRPKVQSFVGDYMEFEFIRHLTGKIQTFIRKKGVTLYMVLLTIYNILLFKYTGQEDIVVGTPIAGRRHDDLQNIIGFFVNTLAMRNFPQGEKTFGEFLAEVSTNALKAYENQDYQFEDLVDRLSIPRDYSRSPLFDTMFAVQNAEAPRSVHFQDKKPKEEVENLVFTPYKYNEKITQFNIIIHAFDTAPANEAITFKLRYCTKLFKRETIERFILHFKQIAQIVMEDTHIRLKNINISHDLLSTDKYIFLDDQGEFGF